MIRLHIKKLLDDKSFKNRKKITLNEVAEETGISRATLTRIVNTPGYNTNTDCLNALCVYFGCQPSDFMEYVEDEKTDNKLKKKQKKRKAAAKTKKATSQK